MLFRSFFRGREDVFAKRFENRKTGKSGYAPACVNEWVRGICEKPRVKCASCSNRAFTPVSNEVVRDHLAGGHVMGIYPMLLDETCWFLAVDLDKAGWQEDARALMETCRRLEVPVLLERSRSGNGAHVWVFFRVPIQAVLARKLGTVLLTETMKERPDLGLDSYDRLFPNQDTLPRGGFGNLIALPLQKEAREKGHSVFLNDQLEMVQDPWAHLALAEKISIEEVKALVGQKDVLGVRAVPDEAFCLEPWKAPPSRKVNPNIVEGSLQDVLKIVVADQIYLPRGELTPSLRNHLLRMAAFQNPEFYKAQAMRLPTYDKPRVIACAEEYEKYLALPRGCLDELIGHLRQLKIRYRRLDKRNKGEVVELKFQGVLREDQQKAVSDLIKHDTGVLAATTAFGKTVVAAWMIAQRGVNTLVLVHRQQLMEQWVERLNQFLDLDAKEIGRLGAGRRKLRGKLDIALLQSVVRKGVVDDRVADYGQVIVDECHHVSARNFELAVRRAKAKYVLGLSATITRKDGHHPIIFMQCGPVRHQVAAKGHEQTLAISKEVLVRPTRFLWQDGMDEEGFGFVELNELLIHDAVRNQMICDDVLKAVRENTCPLVLTERKEHLRILENGLIERGLHVVSILGGMTKGDLRRSMEELEDCDVVLATGKFVGEGFDCPQLDTLFLTLPISWRGILAQYAGRLHRSFEGKSRVRIYDYADINVPMLSRMFDRRCKGYEELGYRVLLPASALPGWPTEVPLPLDTGWKKQFSSSVQRLVRDGVDVLLAELFVDVSRIVDLSLKMGEARARSASEAFLYRRLQGLDVTKDQFVLNVRLPIPFAGQGTMEVDLLCMSKKMVIEIDGPRHFQSDETYRRDRKKDIRLQEQGYRVLRFLAGDLGTHLNEVLDEILRGMS